MISKKFEIDYSNFNPDKEYTIKNEKVSKSNAKIIADAQTGERNKQPEFREKVSDGLKKFFESTIGEVSDRFVNSLEKKENGCIESNQMWIMHDGKQTQIKEYAAIYYGLNFTKECIIQTCKNSKCVNPEHLSEIDRIEQAKSMTNNRPELSRDNGYGKLSNDDIFNIKNLYKETFSKNTQPFFLLPYYRACRYQLIFQLFRND